jgi:hypothetical protein
MFVESFENDEHLKVSRKQPSRAFRLGMSFPGGREVTHQFLGVDRESGDDDSEWQVRMRIPRRDGTWQRARIRVLQRSQMHF